MNEECGAELASGAGKARPWSPEAREADPFDPLLASGAFACLTEVDLFADLSAAEVAEMDLMAPSKLLRRGELLYSQAQPVSALFILKTGRIRVFRVAEDGKALTLAILEPGAVFGEMVLVGQRMYDSYAEAIEDSRVCQLGVEDVERFLLSDPRIAVRVSRLLGERVAELEGRLADLALRPLPARVASTLLSMAGSPAPSRFGRTTPTVRLTHEQVAGLLGATREATSKVLSEFASRGLIRQGRGRIGLQDPAGLRAIARGPQ
ncbi:Crp/Fnr family transcriptional regulator [Sinomonas sp. ASV486]|uniref:Crp/Fnr family transcriptional regulator n=1 Tax=Sinomonas sp. ASV486 TaxID=3051170 RepID=UPI0027DE5CB8|nr:Crp/Fnr family transcriptional regulator [Sinomonas sp. ASV486]MDQ4489263.1 Crp/Fnr family transcriptional regulator [Sinomonas sp. ASV486]